MKFVFKNIVLLVFSFIAVTAKGQEYRIEVVNIDGKPIEKVLVIDEDNNTIGATDANGLYTVKPPAHGHDIRLKKIGYQEELIAHLLDYNKVVLKPKSLNEVNILGNKTKELRKEGTEVLDKCELGKLACCNLAESLENTNTVDVNYSDGITGGREIQMLALAGSYSSQMNEGIPYHRGILSKIGLELVPGPWLESIGISKGIGSVTNGYDNISGTMNLEFLKPKKTLDWNVNGYISEIAKTDVNIVKGFQLNENLYTNFLAHTSFSRITMDNNHDGFTDMPVFMNLNLMNKWNYLSENGFRFQAMLQGESYESQAGQIDHSHHTSHLGSDYVINQNHKSLQAQFKTGWELNSEKESSFAILYKFNYATQDGDIATRIINNDQVYASISPIYYTNLSGENSKIKLGFQSLYNNEHERIGSLHFSKKEFVNGAFAEWTGKNEAVTATLGLRGDYHNELGFFFSPRATFIFAPTEQHSFKFNAGFGFKTPTILTEAFGFLISNRTVQMPTSLEAERAFNGGVSYRFSYKLFGIASTLDASYFLTLFQNQLIMNLETPEQLKIEFLKEKSRAQSFQIDNDMKINANWSLRLSYKNDQTLVVYDGQEKLLPLLKTDKFLANLYWVSTKEKWRFSTTLLVNGRARIPTMSLASENFSPWYPIVHAQINYVPNDRIDFYIGSENIFAYNQYDRIQSFENTNLKSFDAGMIWGPMDVRRMYIGGKLRF
jgi:outer membrane receptor for ferrienterochelin and colicins